MEYMTTANDEKITVHEMNEENKRNKKQEIKKKYFGNLISHVNRGIIEEVDFCERRGRTYGEAPISSVKITYKKGNNKELKSTLISLNQNPNSKEYKENMEFFCELQAAAITKKIENKQKFKEKAISNVKVFGAVVSAVVFTGVVISTTIDMIKEADTPKVTTEQYQEQEAKFDQLLEQANQLGIDINTLSYDMDPSENESLGSMNSLVNDKTPNYHDLQEGSSVLSGAINQAQEGAEEREMMGNYHNNLLSANDNNEYENGGKGK